MLKPLDLKLKRSRNIKNLYSALKHYNYNADGININVKDCINFLFQKGCTNFNNFNKIVIQKYGYSSEKQDEIETIYVKLLSLLSIYLFCLYYQFDDYNENEAKKVYHYLSLQYKKIKNYFPEFKLKNKTLTSVFLGKSKVEISSLDLINDVLPEYINTTLKDSYDNLKNVTNTKAAPIAALINPGLKSENELIGLISKIYKELNDHKDDPLEHLNDSDKIIWNKTWKYLKFLCNNVDAAKGHKSNSTIKIKNISVLIGTSASLLEKLLNTK